VLDNLFNRATVIATVEVPARAAAADLHRLYDEAQTRIDCWLERLAMPTTSTPLELEPLPAIPAASSPYADDRFQEDVSRIK
jgi:hypothetical protein